MTLVQNFPFFSIIIAMFSGILSCALSGKKARNLSLAVIAATTVMSDGGELYLYDGTFSGTLGK